MSFFRHGEIYRPMSFSKMPWRPWQDRPEPHRFDEFPAGRNPGRTGGTTDRTPETGDGSAGSDLWIPDGFAGRAAAARALRPPCVPCPP
jgi:hypothetical protein